MNSKILEKVDDVINGERQDVYGNPEDSFSIIADFWSVYLIHKFKNPKIFIDKKDVAKMMSLFKHARMLGQKESEDNILDAIGYLTILGERLMKDGKEKS